MSSGAAGAAEAWDLLVLSPHLDDAVLSCGGQIHDRARAGERVLVATLGTADEPAAPSPLALRLHRAWGLRREVVAARRREDEAACARLGADCRHLGLEEAIYRFDLSAAPRYQALADLFAPLHPEDEALIAPWSAAVAALPPHRLLLAPVGLGGHVDHLLARRSAERAAGQAGGAVAEVAFYEEYPYLEDAAAAGELVGGLRPETVAVSAEGLAAKTAAVAAYRSQVRPLFGNRWRLRRRLARAHAVAGGERLWRRAP